MPESSKPITADCGCQLEWSLAGDLQFSYGKNKLIMGWPSMSISLVEACAEHAAMLEQYMSSGKYFVLEKEGTNGD